MKTVWTLLLLSLMMRVDYAAPMPLRNATAAEMNTFTRLYREGDDAALRRDIPYLRRNLTADFTARWSSGKTVNRVQYLQYIARLYPQIINFYSATTTVEKLSFRGKQAFVNVNQAVNFTARARDKKVHRFYLVGRSADTWILTSHGWMYQSTRTVTNRKFIDGRFVR